jgi:hypothetical protein
VGDLNENMDYADSPGTRHPFFSSYSIMLFTGLELTYGGVLLAHSSNNLDFMQYCIIPVADHVEVS